MKDIKSELLKTVGDVSKNKMHVIDKVERKINPIKKRKVQLVPLTIGTILIVALFLFMPKILEMEQQQAAKFSVDMTILKMETAINEGYWQDEISAKMWAESNFIEDVALLAYVNDFQITVTDEEIKKAEQQYWDEFHVEQEKTAFETALTKYGYTWDDFEQYVTTHIAKSNALRKKLLKDYKTKYASFGSFAQNELLQFTLNEHFENEHSDLMIELNQQYKLPYPSTNGGTFRAIVLQVTPDALLVAQGYTTNFQKESLLMHFDNNFRTIHWIPKRESMPDVTIGDRILVFSTGQHSGIKATYDNIAIAKNFEVLTDEPVNIYIPETATGVSWLEELDWEQVKFTREQPMYSFEYGEQIFDAWLTADRTTIELYNRTNNRYTRQSVDDVMLWIQTVQ